MTAVGITHLLLLAHTVIALATIAHALLTVRDPRAAWGWIVACWLAPILGPLLYLLLGTRRLSRRARAILPSPQPPPVLHLPDVIDEELRELVRIGGATTGRVLLPGNRLQLLENGEGAYPAMLAAIDVAEHRVWLASYIFSGDQTGEAFAAALARACRRGVDVRVLIDAVGDLYYWPRGSRRLQALGVPVRQFQLARRYLPLPYLNLRNHRKLLIVDHRTAFTGGMNIGDHQRVTGNRHPVLDLHFRLEGPVLGQLAAVFAEDWRAIGGVASAAEPPELPAAGGSHCRVITEGPNEALDRIELILLGALANAHRRVAIMTPYFIPMAVLSRALAAAALRGVDVQVILPERSNLPWVDWASRHWLRSLLESGVRVLLQPRFAHSKLLVVDDYYTHIGSANLDPRSLNLNFELVVETYCADFAAQLGSHIAGATARARELTLADLDRTGLPARLRNAFCWLFSAYL